MPRQRELPSESQFVAPLLRWAKARGADVDALGLRFSLPPDAHTRRTVPVRMRDWSALLDALAAQLAEPALGLRLGGELVPDAYDLAELTARACPNVGEALARLVRYASLIHERMALRLREEGGVTVLTHSVLGEPRGAGRHVSELALAWILRQLRAASDPALAPVRVDFVHARPRDLAPLHACFRTQELEFGCAEDALHLPASALAQPVRSHDPRLLATAEALAEQALKEHAPAFDLIAAVNAKLREQLPRGTPTLADVAERMHMAPRTLQRRLDEQGVQFSELLDLLRAERAKALLKDGSSSLTEIAFSLGFHDLATFSRAFKRWTGMPPGMFRQG